VVPDSPSIKIFFLVASRCVDVDTEDDDEIGWTNATAVLVAAMAIKSRADDLLIIFDRLYILDILVCKLQYVKDNDGSNDL
jgi:hypothetical protein